ncbi:MAG: precorrin-2 C(20)-methyltransferase [Candidatus Bathyarchaeota archaeon]|nr:precorrin-2 C(20)-methyltransferase [Candidatus Bathyarchaeota archaeon]
MTGTFIGIGVGPGDPELITVKAVKALNEADVICVPKSHADKASMALGMVKQILHDRQTPVEILELVFPMSKENLNVKRLWAKNASIVAAKAKTGKVLAFITLGDPMLYSTFLYLHQNVKELYPEVTLKIIPGVTSVTAAAASTQLPLALKDEVVAIIPSDLEPLIIEDTAKHADTLVFMKCANRVKMLIPNLARAGFSEGSTVALVKRCTLPEEKVLVGKLADMQSWDITEDYFSVAIVKRNPMTINSKKVSTH